MFVTCKYCGIVPRDHNCKNKPTKKEIESVRRELSAKRKRIRMAVNPECDYTRELNQSDYGQKDRKTD